MRKINQTPEGFTWDHLHLPTFRSWDHPPCKLQKLTLVPLPASRTHCPPVELSQHHWRRLPIGSLFFFTYGSSFLIIFLVNMQEMCFICEIFCIFILYTLFSLHPSLPSTFPLSTSSWSIFCFYDIHFPSPTPPSYPPFGLLPSTSKSLPTFTHYVHTHSNLYSKHDKSMTFAFPSPDYFT